MNGMTKRTIVSNVSYKTKLDLVKVALDIFEVVTFKTEKLQNREKEALAFYAVYGFSEETKQAFLDTDTGNIKTSYLHTINSNLRTKGYLIKSERNNNISFVEPRIQEIVDCLLESDSGEQSITVKFNRVRRAK